MRDIIAHHPHREARTLRRYDLRRQRMPAGNMNHWQERHAAAVRAPTAVEGPIVDLITSWADYANQHAARFEAGIGEDYVLGPQWEAIGRALRGLLNGETGRLDCGTLDGFLCDTLTAEGFTED